MRTTFGWNLFQFARSVDNLHPEIVDGMKELASVYFLRKNVSTRATSVFTGLGPLHLAVRASDNSAVLAD